VDLNSNSLTAYFPLDSLSGPPNSFTAGWQGDSYFLSGGLWRFDGIEAELVFEKTGTWYGLGVDAERKEFYLFDAKDYVRRGMAYRLNSNFELIDSFETGIIPNSAIFF
jgi:hypothetical protein